MTVSSQWKISKKGYFICLFILSAFLLSESNPTFAQNIPSSTITNVPISITPNAIEKSAIVLPQKTPIPTPTLVSKLTSTPTLSASPLLTPTTITSATPVIPQGPVSTKLDLYKPITIDQFVTIQKKQKLNLAIIEGDFNYNGETIHDFFVVSAQTTDIVNEYKKWRTSSVKNIDEYKKQKEQQAKQVIKSDNSKITIGAISQLAQAKAIISNTDGVFSIIKITAIDKQDKINSFKAELGGAKILFKDSSAEISKLSADSTASLPSDSSNESTAKSAVSTSATSLPSTYYTNRVPNSGTSQIGAISGGGRFSIQHMMWDSNNFADNEIYEHDIFTDNRDGKSYLDPSDTGVAKDYASALTSSRFAGCYPNVAYASTSWPTAAKIYLDTRFNFINDITKTENWYCERGQIAFTIGAAYAKALSPKTDYYTQIGTNDGNSSSDTYTLEAQIGPYKPVAAPPCPPYDYTWCAWGYEPTDGPGGYIALIPALTSQSGWVMPDKTKHTFTDIPIGSTASWQYKGIAPIAPSGVNVSNSTTNSQQVNFTDNSSNETGFSLEIKSNSGSWSNLGNFNALAYYGSYNVGITGLSSGQTYCYRMKANNDAGSSYSNEACGATQQASRSEVIVDDKSGDFGRTGNYWWEATAGYNSHMFYTYINGNTVSSTGEWWPTLTGGNYAVSVYIPNINATTTNAKYEISTNNGTVVKSVNQNNYYNAWVSLGTYNFSSGRSKRVRLTDATGETNYNLKIGFDAIKFTPQ
jgi:hypothetical protein